MHLKNFLPLLLVTSVSALPGRAHNARQDEAPEPTPEPSEPPATTTEEEAPATSTTEDSEPTDIPDLSTDEKCELPFNDGTTEAATDTWKNSGADKFLRDFLEENGVEGWVDNLFRSTIGGGSQGGSTYDCTNFPAQNGCTSPGHELCKNYDPPEMFFVHLSISNLYSAFVRIHEEFQDDMIVNLASEIKKIVDIFGPPPKEDDFIFSILIGVFVGAAALAGPYWTLAAPATGIVGGLNIAAGVSASEPEEDPIDFEGDLEKSLGEFYDGYGDVLEDTVDAIFAGDFESLDYEGDPVDFIMDQFSEGKMVDHTMVNPVMDDWIDASLDLVKKALVIQALIKEEHYIWRDFTKSEDECVDEDNSWGPYSWWIDDMCALIVKDRGASMTGHHPSAMLDDEFEAFTDTYGFDYEEVLRNAIECDANGGGEADLTELPAFDETPSSLPACFCNFEIKVKDFYGRTPDRYY